MINYIIAVNSHARRNNLMSLCPYQHYQWWYNNRHDFILDWLCLYSWTQNLCILQGESDLHLLRFSLCHDIPPQFYLWKQMDNKCEWDQKNLFMFYIWRSWAVLHCWIILLLQNIYLVGFVWLLLYGILISNICDDPIMIQQLALTSFFTNYKPNKTIQSLPCWNGCMWVHHCCITSLFMFCINDFTLFYWFH